MIEALDKFSEEINYCYIDPIEDEQFREFLSSIPLHKIFIMRDFSPFARKRYEFFSSICTTEEVDDATVYPVDDMGTYNKLAYFISGVKKLTFREPKLRKIDWKEETDYLDIYKETGFLHKGKINIPYKENKNLLVHPRQLPKLLDKIVENLKGYSVKKIREQVSTPKVSYLSTFIKFGLISIRSVHAFVRDCKGISSDDKLAFERELYFKDFFYRLAWNKTKDVFEKPNWQGLTPRFINEEDLIEFKKQNGKKPTIFKDELEDIKQAREIYDRFTRAETEYPLINASIMQLKNTGYMINRTRMLVVSYLCQDNKLWWKYAEKFFANNLTEYDWTINSMNHQNIAKVGLYPKYTQNFSIKRQESMNRTDKEKYIKQNLKK